MGRRNRNLLIAFVGLLVLNLILVLTGNRKNSVSFDEDLFAIENLNGIQNLTIGEITLTKNGEVWLVNKQHPADPNLMQLLMSFLQKVAVKKPVSDVGSNAKTVEINGELAFKVSSNATKTKTFFALNDKTYEVHIPGYNEFLGGIFELQADQWRDRMLLDASWRTIQDLNLDYAEASMDDLSIQFNENFFTVKGVARLDSNRVVDYLNQFQVFQVNEWISAGRFGRYDSLSKTNPIAELTISTISANQPIKLEIFPQLGSEQFYLVKGSNGSLMVIDEIRMNAILQGSSDFEMNE